MDSASPSPHTTRPSVDGKPKTIVRCSSVSTNGFRVKLPYNLSSAFKIINATLNTLKCNATQRNTEILIKRNTTQHNTIHYNAMQRNTIQYNTTQCNTMQYNTVQCYTVVSTIQYNAMQCNAIQYNTMQCNATQNNTTKQCNAIQYNSQYNAYILLDGRPAFRRTKIQLDE